ncbi:unnamed protein product [Calypogeia fissa]
MHATPALAMVLASMCSAAGMMLPVDARTGNRPADGFEHSGYAWPKTVLWHSIRFAPGSLWFFYYFLDTALFMSFVLFCSLALVVEDLEVNKIVTESRKILLACQAAILGAGLLYLSLSVTTLSDVMEAYLAGMVAVQVVLATPRIRDNRLVRLMSMSAFQLSAVLGIAMLDSYHPLNVLNLVYSFMWPIMTTIFYYTERLPFNKRCAWDMLVTFIQMVFSIAAFLIARRVEGTHQGPMLAILVTPCAYTGCLILPMLLCLDTDSTAAAADNQEA